MITNMITNISLIKMIMVIVINMMSMNTNMKRKIKRVNLKNMTIIMTMIMTMTTIMNMMKKITNQMGIPTLLNQRQREVRFLAVTTITHLVVTAITMKKRKIIMDIKI